MSIKNARNGYEIADELKTRSNTEIRHATQLRVRFCIENPQSTSLQRGSLPEGWEIDTVRVFGTGELEILLRKVG